MIEEEKWVDIEGYEGLYQISSLGRVKSLGRRVTRVFAGKEVTKYEAERMLSPQTGHYPSVKLSKDGIVKTHPVHYLVATAFITDKPEGAKRLKRIDGNPWNVAASNLTYRQGPKKPIKPRSQSKPSEEDPLGKEFMAWVRTPAA